MADGPRLRQIDEQSRPDHLRLSADDQCFYLYEYTSGQNYSFSATNSLISNLKKKAGSGGYQYKERAIAQCARELGAAINPDWLNQATVVPVPPSKMKGDPAYDDRVIRICRQIRSVLDVRELVVQTASLPAAHESPGNRPTVEELLRVYRIHESPGVPDPKAIGIFDDVLTVGTHFVAMKRMLSNRFPGVPILGCFVARRVFPNPFEEFVDDL